MAEDQNITLRKMTIADASLLSDVAIRSYSDHYRDTWYDNGEWYLEKSFSVQNLKEELSDINALFYIVYANDEPVGFFKLNIDAALDQEANKHALELERIYLIQTAAGKGIGAFLINFIIQLAREKNKDLIWLKVMQSSPAAIAFYTKAGFEICGTHRVDFVQKKEELRDMFIMKKMLQ